MKLLAASIILLSLHTFSYSDEAETVAKELIVFSGSSKAAVQKARLNTEALKSARNDLPDEFFDRFLAKVTEEEIIKLYAPIYAKHLTSNEMKQLIAFFKSPIGTKFRKVQPILIKEGADAAQAWSQGISVSILSDMGLLESE